MSNSQVNNETAPSFQGRTGDGSPFLYHVAQDLIGRYGNNLSDVTIVFPGKRAQLYMKSFLSHIAQGPVWAPRFVTIDELFQQFSPYTPSDSIRNVCTLYNIYARLVPSAPSLDDFYSWGEILMNDFDDIDKHMVPADKLFTNVAELAAMDRVDYLNDTQIQALRQFFEHFDPDRQTDLKKRFLEMWQAMPQMYHQLKDELRRQGLMYKGALYREVVENVKSEEHRAKIPSNDSVHFCFVGFNVLDEVEEALFMHLRDAGQALFYWDYDIYYTQHDPTHEAGLFLRHNLELFPNALPNDIFDNLIDDRKQIHILSTASDNAQARYLPQWLQTLPGEALSEAAVVLCDEALMRPVLHAIPDHTEVNLTMGYPLTDTAICGYLSALFDLQVDGYDTESQAFRPTALERVEKNPFYPTLPQDMRPIVHQTDKLQLIDWLMSAIEAVGRHLGQSSTDTPSGQSEEEAEATFQLYQTLSQFRWVITEGILDVRPTTLRRLVRQALQSASIPFHGEEDRGLQVMGLLEARTLDFRHLIMLSVGEGIIPRRASDTSLIPYILRTSFGLDTTERQDAVYAYSFYRLLQRAQDITLVYNNNSSGTSQREQSRFLRQLEAETPLRINFLTDAQQVSLAPSSPIVVEKDANVMDRLMHKGYLSPTAINQYIECPLRFYYQQVADIRMPQRPQDGIDPALFGTLFHDTCEHFYRQLILQIGRKQVLASDLQPYIGQPALLAPSLDAAFGDLQSRSGVNMIIREVIAQLVLQLLRWDQAHAPFTLYDMELEVKAPINILTMQGPVTITIGGRIDRLDIMSIGGQPTLRVIDYKTGRAKTAPRDISAIFDGHTTGARGYYLQTILYSLIMARRQELPVSPGLFYILSATDAQQYDPILRFGREPITDIRDIAGEYNSELHRIISEIFDASRPFVQTDDEEKHCQYCDFRRLCGKK